MRKSRESKKIIELLKEAPAIMRNGCSILPCLKMPKDPTHNEALRHQSKMIKLVPATEKYLKPVKKSRKYS